MLYQRSRQIEERLADLIRLLRSGGYSTPALAKALGVSRPTVSRCLAALRGRGYVIHAVKDAAGWSYELAAEPALTRT